jgi:hypothetical protein
LKRLFYAQSAAGEQIGICFDFILAGGLLETYKVSRICYSMAICFRAYDAPLNK